MRLAIMQPYFFPYIGYFQLMNAVDEFVVYDNIEYTKKGWINRNRILQNGSDEYITLPLKKDSDFLDVRERYLADTWDADRKKMLNKIAGSYRKAPYFSIAYPVIEKSILFEDRNLFQFILNSILQVKEYTGISTSVQIASELSVGHELKAGKKVIEICRIKEAGTYINPIGGVGLYSKEDFSKEAITLQFLKTNDISYDQFNAPFVPFLSIIDVMMFNSKERIKEYLDSFYTLI